MINLILTSLLLTLVTFSSYVETSVALQPLVRNFGIIGGHPINITEVPFMAMYRPKQKKWYCGASIVHEQFVITAAHCAAGRTSYKNCRVTVGSDDINGGKDYEVEAAFVHPNFSKITIDYDLAVIKLKSKLEFSDRIKPIKMSNTSPHNDGEILDTLGFGTTEKGKLSEKLLQVRIPFVNRKKCISMYESIPLVTDRMICAGEEGKDSCQGDSGGPLRYKGELIGVVSWGKGCGEPGYPGVYSYIPSMRDFIDEVIKNNA